MDSNYKGDKAQFFLTIAKLTKQQITIIKTFVWSTAFTLYFYGLVRTDIRLIVIGHIALSCYYTCIKTEQNKYRNSSYIIYR